MKTIYENFNKTVNNVILAAAVALVLVLFVMASKDDEAVEQVAEEAVEQVAEEAVEQVAEEAVEQVAEEAVEQVAEEATE
jgi:type III secretory pathway component EscR